jgi:hypothetical protein
MPTAEENNFLVELKARQESKQKEMRLIDEITGYFIEKKRLLKRGYTFRGSPKTDKYFEDAAAICRDYDLSPGIFVDIAYKRLPKPEYFNPSHLAGTPVRMHIKNSVHSGGKTEFDSNFTITAEELWNYQNEVLKLYTSRGMTAAAVLGDPGLKFRAWFRILATAEENDDIINRYKDLAKQELTNSLKDFLVSKNLPIARITKKK